MIVALERRGLISASHAGWYWRQMSYPPSNRSKSLRRGTSTYALPGFTPADTRGPSCTVNNQTAPLAAPTVEKRGLPVTTPRATRLHRASSWSGIRAAGSVGPHAAAAEWVDPAGFNATRACTRVAPARPWRGARGGAWNTFAVPLRTSPSGLPRLGPDGDTRVPD